MSIVFTATSNFLPVVVVAACSSTPSSPVEFMTDKRFLFKRQMCGVYRVHVIVVTREVSRRGADVKSTPQISFINALKIACVLKLSAYVTSPQLRIFAAMALGLSARARRLAPPSQPSPQGTECWVVRCFWRLRGR